MFFRGDSGAGSRARRCGEVEDTKGPKRRRRMSKMGLSGGEGKIEREEEKNVKDGTVRWLINLWLAFSQHNLMSLPTNREGVASE